MLASKICNKEQSYNGKSYKEGISPIYCNVFMICAFWLDRAHSYKWSIKDLGFTVQRYLFQILVRDCCFVKRCRFYIKGVFHSNKGCINLLFEAQECYDNSTSGGYRAAKCNQNLVFGFFQSYFEVFSVKGDVGLKFISYFNQITFNFRDIGLKLISYLSDIGLKLISYLSNISLKLISYFNQISFSSNVVFEAFNIFFHHYKLFSGYKPAYVAIPARLDSVDNSFSDRLRKPFGNKVFNNIMRIKRQHNKCLNFITRSLKDNLINIKKIAMLLVTFLLMVPTASQAKCTGRFVNPIADICWECLFPISIGSTEIISGDNPDTDNPSSPICACGTPVPRIGIAAGFWEPVRLVDVTKRPFCFVNLGGVEFDPGIAIGTGNSPRSTGRAVGSWHVHWYIYPLIYWLELVVDFLCLEQMSFDIAYITELDPLWGDDTLTFILNPEAVLFANPIAQAACAADCVAASTGLPMDSLFWCGGCQGSMYPLSGNVQGHVGSIQSALLATERMAYKLHRELIAWGTSGPDALCEKYPMPVMKKSQYRSQLTVPIPSDCYPFGRTTTLYESGKEIPIVGEDFGFLIWRKRNCCVL